MGTNCIKELFAKRLRFLRMEKNKRQSDVAEALGVSSKTYSKWETGENEPDFLTVSKLADYFGVSFTSFFTGEVITDTESKIDAEFENLSATDAADKAFELQFAAIRSLAKRALFSKEYENPTVVPPENRVNPENHHAITAYAFGEAYGMMYNGLDANISLSIMPAKDKYSFLFSERERIGEYLSLIGNQDMLRCLPYMISQDLSCCYSADYIGKKAGISAKKAAELLDRAEKLGICKKNVTQIGDKATELFSTQASRMLLGILILTHLSLPETEKNGCWFSGMPVCRIALKDQGELR